MKVMSCFGGGGKHLTSFFVGMSGAKRQNEGLKNWLFFLFFFAKVRSKELKIFNILRAYALKFEPNLDCRAENVSNL